MALSFALRRTLSLIFILVFLADTWLVSTHQDHGLQCVHSILDSIHWYYPITWLTLPASFPRSSDPTRGY